MKKFTLTLTILTACCALAYAGPETYSGGGKEVKEVVQPSPPSCPNWGGFYIGAFGGYKAFDTNSDLFLDGDWIAIDDTDRFDLQNRASEDLDPDGGEVGGIIGYNFQFNHWVFGLEVDGGYMWARDNKTTGNFFANGNVGGEFDISTSFEQHYLVTGGARIGYAFCRWLPYITGGAAGGDLQYKQIIHSNFGNGGNNYRQGGSVDDTNIGWMAGGGLEYAITNHWRARVQYQYIDLGSVDFDSAGEPAVFNTFTGHHEIDVREHNASFAIIYGF